MRVVCRHISPGLLPYTMHMFGTHHCCYSSSSCLSETCELAPASAGSERRTFIFECAVCALRSTSDVACPTATWRIVPTIVSVLLQSTRRRDRKFSSIRGWLPIRRQQRKLSLHASIKPWSIRQNMPRFSSTKSFDYTVSQRLLSLTGIHASPASSGDRCLTCSVWISSSVLCFICRLMVDQSG